MHSSPIRASLLRPATPDNTAHALFAAEGLPTPPVPPRFSAALRPSGGYVLSSCKLAHPLYQLALHFDAARQGTAPDHAAVGFDGHGINSWAAHFYLVDGPAAIFLQCRWGNAFGDAKRAKERIEGVFGLVRQLLSDLEKAVQEGKLPEGRRLLLRVSDTSHSGWGWSNQPQEWHDDGDLSLLCAISAVCDLTQQGTLS